MSYTLNEFYKAIAKTERTIGNYQMSDETEYGSGSIYFYNKQMSYGNPTVGKYLSIYATPAWGMFDYDDETVIDKTITVNIAVQMESDFDSDCIDDNDDNQLVLTGDLLVDIEAYYEAIRKIFSINNIY